MIEIVLLIFASLFIITQVSWWIFHFPWPSWNFCYRINKNINGWFTSVTKLLGSLEIPTVFGPIAFAMMVSILIMNITLLAMVFEMVLPPGERITIPLIGSYGIYTLITGALFGLVQVAFGLILKMRKKEGDSTLGVIILIIVTIVFESGMSIWRALMLTSGEQLISPTLWDQAILFGGPILSGLLGVVIPLADILLGRYAFFNFIEPLVKDILLSVRISISYIGLGMVWVFFGFHDLPKREVESYKNNFNHLSSSLNKLVNKIVVFENKLKQLFQILSSLKNLKNQKDDLLIEIESSKSEWNKMDMRNRTTQNIKDFIARAKTIDSKSEVYRFFNSVYNKIKHNLNELEIILDRLDNNNKSVNSIISDQGKLKKELVEFEKIKNDIKTLDTELTEEITGLENQVNELKVEFGNFSPLDKTYLAAYNPVPLNDKLKIERAKVKNQETQYENIVKEFAANVKQFEVDLKNIDTFSIQEINEMQSGFAKIQNDVEDIRNNLITEWLALRMELLSRTLKFHAIFLYFKLLFQYKKRIEEAQNEYQT